MDPIFSRTARIMGMKALKVSVSRQSRSLASEVSVLEAVRVRAGGHLIFIDKDEVDITNLNRQLVGLNDRRKKIRQKSWYHVRTS